MKNYAITMYDLEEHKFLNTIDINGLYINSKLIVQNKKGNMFNVAINDNSRFSIVIFNHSKEIKKLNVNTVIGLEIEANDFTEKSPMINTLFLDNDDIFVNVFWPINMMNYHFVYSWRKNTVLGEVVTT
jgi:hypothetical protein